MQITNLTNHDVKELETKLGELMKQNSEIEYTIFKDMKGMAQDTLLLKKGYESTLNNKILQKLSGIETKIEGIENMIKLIFGNYVLLNGRFIEMK